MEQCFSLITLGVDDLKSPKYVYKYFLIERKEYNTMDE